MNVYIGTTEMDMNEKKYLIDGEPVSPKELIARARAVGYGERQLILTTVGAFHWLRNLGCVLADQRSNDVPPLGIYPQPIRKDE